jgi:hypothetical protein
MRWERHVARMRKRNGIYKDMVRKPEGRRPFGRPRRGWEDNIKMDLQEVGWEEAWTGSSWLRIGTSGGTCECGDEPSGPIKCGEFLV